MKNSTTSYRAYDPDSEAWYDLPRTAVSRSVLTRKARPVSQVLPDETIDSQPAQPLRRPRADGAGGIRRP